MLEFKDFAVTSEGAAFLYNFASIAESKYSDASSVVLSIKKAVVSNLPASRLRIAGMTANEISNMSGKSVIDVSAIFGDHPIGSDASAATFSKKSIILQSVADATVEAITGEDADADESEAFMADFNIKTVYLIAEMLVDDVAKENPVCLCGWSDDNLIFNFGSHDKSNDIWTASDEIMIPINYTGVSVDITIESGGGGGEE